MVGVSLLRSGSLQAEGGDSPGGRIPQDIRLGDRFETVARKVGPAVVAVEAAKPGKKGKSVDESGSGVMIRVQGHAGVYVLTNNHVISQAQPSQITVTLHDNRILHPVQVWSDPESDIGLLRLEGGELLPTAQTGDSDLVRPGQWVLAFGSPFGLHQSVTHGIISARERGQVSLGSTIRIKEFLQTDAAINPGSSGGPLVNVEGEIIGLNTAIASHSGNNSGVAFSIPINLVKKVAANLLEKGVVARGYLGLQVAGSFETADALKLGLERLQGALIESILPETPAAKAGLRSGDVVLQIDAIVIRNENHFINVVSGLEAGKQVRLRVWRDRVSKELPAVIGSWNEAQEKLKTEK
ncbi:MAG: PDZ domain-containing protein [Gemmataceae bacterium]|nr:PDZ domain-containing protein [Gemmataceae bacterium]